MPWESTVNEKTKQRLVSELNVPAPTQPVDKLRLAESPAEGVVEMGRIGGVSAECAMWCINQVKGSDCRMTGMCFAEDK